MAEQQSVCLLAQKMAKVFLAGFKLDPVYAGCQHIKMGRGRGVVTVLSQVQKQGMVCAVFI